MTDDIEKSNFNPQMLKACTDTSYECGYQQGRADAIEEYMNILLKNFSSTRETEKILLSIVRADIRLRAEQLLKEQNETEEWHSIHGNVIMPKGTFDRIYNSCCDDDDDDI